MKHGGVRRLRGAFLALAAGVAVAVFFSLRHRPDEPPAPGAGGPARPASSPGTQRLDQALLEVMKAGSQDFKVEAGEWIGGKESPDARLKDARVSFGYVARGQPGRATISAREATLTPELPRAIFRGAVVLITDDGFRLESDELVYRGDKQLARTDGPARFRRKDFSGSATGFLYDAAADRLELNADVHILMRDPDVPALDIRAARGAYAREEGLLRLEGDVRLDRADGSRLVAGAMKLNVDEQFRVFRAQFSDDFEMLAQGAGLFPGTQTGTTPTGPRELRGRKLDLWFGENRALKQAIAGPDAEMVLRPAPGGRAEVRRLKAETLTLDFDAAGRLTALTGIQGSSLALEPLDRRATPVKIDCRRFAAQVSPETGDPTHVEFQKDVRFARGSQRASAERADWDDSGLLALRDEPRLWDEVRATELLARDIDVVTATGDIVGRVNVRHVYRQQAGAPAGLLGAPGEATVITSQRFTWRAQGQVAEYLEGATLRAGKDLLEADELRIEQPEGGARSLHARQTVRSRMSPRGSGTGPAPPQVESRSEAMDYDEKRREIVYAGKVSLTQAEIRVESERATLQLAADGGGFERLVAGEPVTVQSGLRVATGARAVYTPADGQVLLTGPEVVLKDPERTARGRSVTFHVGDDLILIDGHEETRTETVFQGRPAKPAPAPTPSRSPR